MPKSLEEFFGNSGQHTNPQETIKNNFRDRLGRLQSMLLPENEFTIKPVQEASEEYKNALEEYGLQSDKIEAYEKEHPKDIKGEFIDQKDLNVGWKFHLNVKPEYVKAVSDYLIQNGYYHKYLSGGEIEDGKIFTVYIGSYELAERLAQDLSHNLYQYLCKAGENQEIEFAAGIVGRFVGHKKDFAKYGSCGFSWTRINDEQLLSLMSYHKDDPDFKERKEKLTRTAEERAYKILLEKYGDYFFKGK